MSAEQPDPCYRSIRVVIVVEFIVVRLVLAKSNRSGVTTAQEFQRFIPSCIVTATATAAAAAAIIAATSVGFLIACANSKSIQQVDAMRCDDQHGTLSLQTLDPGIELN